MKVINVHSRDFAVSRSTVWEKIEMLSSKKDPIWPFESWPRMILYPGLVLGAKGGHGPIRYTVDEIKIGEEIKFKFLSPKGFDGYHVLKLETNEKQSVLRHEIRMNVSFSAFFLWIFVIKHLHDALIEDAFTKLEGNLKLQQKVVKWNLWVKLLRYVLKG